MRFQSCNITTSEQLRSCNIATSERGQKTAKFKNAARFMFFQFLLLLSQKRIRMNVAGSHDASSFESGSQARGWEPNLAAATYTVTYSLRHTRHTSHTRRTRHTRHIRHTMRTRLRKAHVHDCALPYVYKCLRLLFLFAVHLSFNACQDVCCARAKHRNHRRDACIRTTHN